MFQLWGDETAMSPYVVMHKDYLLPLVACLAAWVFGEAYLYFKASRETVYSESVSDWILGLLTILGLFIPFQLAFNRDAALAPTWAYSCLGLFILAVGVALRMYAIKVLGSYFTHTLALSRDHRLIISGPYRHIRHPAYTGSILAFLGLGLSFASPYTLMCPLIIAPGVAYRIKREEKMLVQNFGAGYEQYRHSTHALWPRWDSLFNRRRHGASLIDTGKINR